MSDDVPLVIGRFQPLHHGHAALLRHAFDTHGRLIVGIGSSEARGGFTDPFTADERRQMVDSLFPGAQAAGRLWIVDIPDIGDPPNYVAHVEQTLQMQALRADRFYGNDPDTADLFAEAGYEVEAPGLVERDWFEGKTIREMMAERDPEWRRLVPDPVGRLLESWRAEQRLQRLGARRRR